MKKVSADYIFPGNCSPIKNGVVVLTENGIIDAILDPKLEVIDYTDVAIFKGIICPGFINTHCHLELSYLKGKITEGTQLPNFVKQIIVRRDSFSLKERQEAIRLADQEMIKNGIVAVGDISNGDSSFSIKKNSLLNYHTFIEVFGSDPKIAETAFENSNTIYKSYFDKNRASITPHATYSVSDNLSKRINAHAIQKNSLISIHNQETESENLFFKEGKGELFDFLDIAKKTNNGFIPSGKNALESFLSKYKNLKKILLVHNTFSKKEDIFWANAYSKNIFWCFCPNANRYIEGKQPNYALFENEKCTIGTDSLASNWGLCILEELKTISKKDASISLETLIRWATYNGANYLGFQELGTLEKGKKPGLNLIKDLNLEALVLEPNSTVQKLY